MHKTLIAIITFFILSTQELAAIELVTDAQKGSPPKYIYTASSISSICPDIYQELNAKLADNNIKINITLVGIPFSRIKKRLKDSTIDIFCGITKNKEREKLYILNSAL